MDTFASLTMSAVQIALGLVFAIGAVSKLARWREFTAIVAAYELLPARSTTAAAVLIVTLEIGVGGALLARWAPSASAVAAAALLMAFAAAMAVNIKRGRTALDCGCFGASMRQPLEWRLVARNVIAAGAALATAVAAAAPFDATPFLSAVPAGAVLFILYLGLNAVWALDASRRRAFGG